MLIKVTAFFSDTDEPYEAWVNPACIDSIDVFPDKPGLWQVNTTGLSRLAIKSDDLQKIIDASGEYPAEKYARTSSALMRIFHVVDEIENVVLFERPNMRDETYQKFRIWLHTAADIINAWRNGKFPPET